jgi:hypothetical protein
VCLFSCPDTNKLHLLPTCSFIRHKHGNTGKWAVVPGGAEQWLAEQWLAEQWLAEQWPAEQWPAELRLGRSKAAFVGKYRAKRTCKVMSHYQSCQSREQTHCCRRHRKVAESFARVLSVC